MSTFIRTGKIWINTRFISRVKISPISEATNTKKVNVNIHMSSLAQGPLIYTMRCNDEKTAYRWVKKRFENI